MPNLDDQMLCATTLQIVEAAYQRAHLPTPEWGHAVARAARPALDRGLGAMFQIYQNDGRQMRYTDIFGEGISPEVTAAVHELASHQLEVQIELFRQPVQARTASEALSPDVDLRTYPPFANLRRAGVLDFAAAQAFDASGIGISVVSPLPDLDRIEAGTQRRWQHIAQHLLAALRLHRALRASQPERGLVEAVLTSSGRIEHLEGAARQRAVAARMREEVRRIQLARERNASGALEIWRGLVLGRWSLIDQHEADGKRYLVLRRNEPCSSAAPGVSLTRRERQVAAYLGCGYSNKEIAYALGVNLGTISGYVRDLRRKLGASSRVDLALRASRLGCAD